MTTVTLVGGSVPPTNTGSSVLATTTANIPINTAVIAFVSGPNGSAVWSTLSDGTTNSYTQVLFESTGTLNGTSAVWCCLNTANAVPSTSTITANYSSGGFSNGFFVIASISVPMAVVDVTKFTTATGPSSSVSATLTSGSLATSSEVLFGFTSSVTGANTPMTLGGTPPGFTNLSRSSLGGVVSYGHSFEYDIVSTSASVNLPYTWTCNGSHVIDMVSYLISLSQTLPVLVSGQSYNAPWEPPYFPVRTPVHQQSTEQRTLVPGTLPPTVAGQAYNRPWEPMPNPVRCPPHLQPSIDTTRNGLFLPPIPILTGPRLPLYTRRNQSAPYPPNYWRGQDPEA